MIRFTDTFDNCGRHFFSSFFSVEIYRDYGMDFGIHSVNIHRPSVYFPEFSREIFAFMNTRINWRETPEAYVFKIDLPWFKKEEV